MFANINKTIVTLCLTALFLVGCGSTPEPEMAEDDHRRDAPDWFIHLPSSGPNEVYGFGMSHADPDNPDVMRRMARNRALNDLATILQSHQAGLANEYSETNDQVTRQELRQSLEGFVDVEVTGAEVMDTYWSESGRWYYHVRMDLDRDFERVYEALGAEQDTEQQAIRQASDEHLERLESRRARQHEEGRGLIESLHGGMGH